jgi:hypothetical protein
LVLAAAAPAAACDVCAIYTATEMREARTGWVVGVAEQATRYKTGVPDATTGEPEDVGERLNSFITQVFAGYDFHPKFGVQVNLPIIARDYHRLRDRRLVDDRIKDGVMTKGNVSGPGDVALVAILRPWSRVTAETLLRFTLIGGLKLPSGDPGKLVEEQKLRRATEAEAAASRTAAAGRARIASAHHIPEGSPSGINGHDLALGSGSIDGIIGGAAFASWERLFTNWSVQHAIRSEGAYRYQYGDETNWFVGVGGYVLLAHDHTLTLEVVTSGKYQGTDTIEGTSTAADGEDSTTTFVFVGPALGVTWGTSFAFELAGDLPVVRPDEGLFPAYRVRGGLSWRF